MANVPDNPVAWCVEYTMQRDGEFNRTQIRREMAPGLRYGLEQKRSQFVCEWLKPRSVEATQIGR
jgi:hypothetical protein